MSNEQLATIVGSIIVGNGAAVWAIAKWGVVRAIEWTHMKRDIKELQKFKETQEAANAQVLRDLRGISMKIDARMKELKP